ncbi:MAG: biotin/lipoyl-binding protein, partial [Parafilimonas terrae]|nr:biotin/lipoyl-binding protein [Parafilimonas terrae]
MTLPVATRRLPVGSSPAPSEIHWRRYAVAGYALIAATFGVGGLWAALARLDRAVIGPGVVVVEGNRKVVQHLEGGIVQEVLVRDGQRVRTGDVLLRVDP